MTDEAANQKAQADADLQREILLGRKFTLEEAIARMAGPGAMKGESPIARLEQARYEIEAWIGARLPDAGGGLRIALNRYVQNSEILLNGFEHPLEAIASCCRHVLESEYLLSELVRNADVEWGRSLGERPHFERGGGPPHPGDPYTIASVRATLQQLLELLPVDH